MKYLLLFTVLFNYFSYSFNYFSYSFDFEVREVLSSSISYLEENSISELNSSQQEVLISKLSFMLSNHLSNPALSSKKYPNRRKLSGAEIAFVDKLRPPVYVTKSFKKIPLKLQVPIYIHELAHTIGLDECASDTMMYFAVKYSMSNFDVLPLSRFEECSYQNQKIWDRVKIELKESFRLKKQIINFAPISY